VGTWSRLGTVIDEETSEGVYGVQYNEYDTLFEDDAHAPRMGGTLGPNNSSPRTQLCMHMCSILARRWEHGQSAVIGGN